MAKSNIINPVEEQEKSQALFQPHNLFVADELLDLKIDAYNSSMTLGFRSPAGQMTPIFTLKMPLSFYVHLTKTMAASIAENKEKIIEEHKELHGLL